MKLSIMQPYFLPYLGYFQLIASSDTFVIYDDVNFIKGGFINRNQYLYQGEAKYFHIELSGASSNKKINEIELLTSAKYNPREKLLTTFQMAYRKAPMYDEVFPLLAEIILYPETNLAKYLEHSLRRLCSYLEIPANILVSSQIGEKDNRLAGEAKVINICRCLGADTYINAQGGRCLYHPAHFAREGLRLYFISMRPVVYPQFNAPFVPALSIADVLMFNGRDKTRQLLGECDLTP